MRSKLFAISAAAASLAGATLMPAIPALASANIDPGFGFTAVTGLTGGTVVLTTAQLQNGHIDLQGTLTSNLVLQIPAGNVGEWTFSNSLVCTKFNVSIQYSGQAANTSPVIPCFAQAVRIWATGTTVLQPPAGVISGANILHNGDMLIDQLNEGTAPTVSASSLKVVDRWYGTWTVSTSSAGNPTVGQQAVSAGLVGPAKSLIWTSSATAGSTVPAAYQGIVFQTIEGTDMADLQWGTAQGLPGSVSLWLKSNQVSSVVGVFVQNTGSARSFVHNCTTSASSSTWTYCSFPIVSDSTGTWSQTVGATGAILGVSVACGATFQATVTDAWSGGNFTCNSSQTQIPNTASATLETTMIKFERGVQPTSYNVDPLPVALAKAQRFFRKTAPPGTIPTGTNGGVTGAFCQIAFGTQGVNYQFNFAPPMFAAPTVTTFNPATVATSWRDITASSSIAVSVDPNTAKSANGVQISSATGGASLDQICIHATFDVGK